MKLLSLHFKWTVSRGRDTFGYNICTLLVDGQKKGRCMGSGYDMKGTALAQWLENNYQDELTMKFKEALDAMERLKIGKTFNSGKRLTYYSDLPGFYGGTMYCTKDGIPPRFIKLDGATGFSPIQLIAEEIGIKLQWNPKSAKMKNHDYYTAIIN